MAYTISTSTSLPVNRLRATPPVVFPIAGSATKPVPFEIHEPDFNKAIASVIWARHHRQPTSTVFKCPTVNCPLCPADRAPDRSLVVEQKLTTQPQQKKTSRTDGPTFVNWLISSSTPTSKQGADCKRPLSCTPSSPAKRFAPSSSSSSSDQRIKVTQARLKFQCSSCPMSFASEYQLCGHRPVHSKGLYPCQFCQKRFSKPSSWIRHRRIHTGERPFRCDLCQKTFAQISYLNAHFKSRRHIKMSSM